MSRSSRAGVLTATALSVAVAATFTASPAFAAPWDGNEVVFGPGEWEPYSSSFMMEDVYLYFPDTSTEYVDIWDGAGETFIDAPGLGITDEAVECDSDSDVDVETDAGTGDLVFTCEQTNASFGTAGLDFNQDRLRHERPALGLRQPVGWNPRCACPGGFRKLRAAQYGRGPVDRPLQRQ